MTARAGPRVAVAAAAFAVFGVGCGGDVSVAAGSSSSASYSSSDAASTSTSGPGGGSSSAADAPTEGVACDAIEQPSIELLIDRPMGLMTRYDVDLDGKLDVVGVHGVIVRHTQETDEVLEVGVTADARPGRFVAGDRPGLVYKPGVQNDLVVIADVLVAEATSVVTPDVDPALYTVGDFDSDGLEDALLTISDRVEIWRGNPDGVFTFYADARGFDLPVATFFRGSSGQVGVAVGSVFHSLHILEISGMQLEEVAALDAAVSSIRALDPTGEGIDGILIDWWWAQLESHSGVALLFGNAEAWDGPSYSLEGEPPIDEAPLDLDGDGDLDLVVAVAQAEGSRLDMLCLDHEEYVLCGRVALQETPRNIGALADPNRVVLSSDHGTSVLLLPPPNCG